MKTKNMLKRCRKLHKNKKKKQIYPVELCAMPEGKKTMATRGFKK
jgi:hypothetical protein